ncbi:MAG: hypothetical protein ACJA2X_003114 [Halocynthiibacter sp.]|jgi:hypothetical protein
MRPKLEEIVTKLRQVEVLTGHSHSTTTTNDQKKDARNAGVASPPQRRII